MALIDTIEALRLAAGDDLVAAGIITRGDQMRNLQPLNRGNIATRVEQGVALATQVEAELWAAWVPARDPWWSSRGDRDAVIPGGTPAEIEALIVDVIDNGSPAERHLFKTLLRIIEAARCIVRAGG